MPRGNEYHVLHQKVHSPKKPLPKALEAQAQALSASGRLYINADNVRNFVQYTAATMTYRFSARELHDPALLEGTKQVIARSIPRGLGPLAVNERLDLLENELKKARGIDAARELQVARLVVQAAHPKVIDTLLAERTQVFVSFSHNVGDLMPVHHWHTHGTASGLQATDESGAAVYVSCGGDPLFDGPDEQKYYATDGADALARFMVIGGQELGHYADLMRTSRGMIGRHSAHMQPLAPTPACKGARDADIAQVARLQAQAHKAGLAKLCRAEEAVSFYEKQQQKYAPMWFMAQLRRFWHFRRVRRYALVPPYVKTRPRLRYGQFMRMCLNDMAFNLSPDADVYRRENPQEEEAIACIEALARVPQQAAKWGHAATKAAWPNLYDFYYKIVIGAL